MLCAVVGDSIALGVSPYLPECTVDAKIGISSAAVIGRVHEADVLIVSAGSNDPDNPSLVSNLERIRAKATGKVIRIRPVNLKAAMAVLHVAGQHGDLVVSFEPGRDHVHP